MGTGSLRQVHWQSAARSVALVVCAIVPTVNFADIPAGRFVNDLPVCSGVLFESLMAIDHSNGNLQELIDNRDLMATCTTAPAVDSTTDLGHRASVFSGTVNFESPHVHPLDLTPDGQTLLAVNTAAHRLEVFDVNPLGVSQRLSTPVGLEPVSVRALNDEVAWVVNQVSDSISVVDLTNGAVTHTLSTGNEPADVVFSTITNRAFVSIADSNEIEVYSLGDLSASPQRIDAGFEEPRALAISADGMTLFAASFYSGSDTTVLSGRPGPITSGAQVGTEDVVSRADSPWSGANPVPNQGNQFSPALTAGNPGFSSLIVQSQSDGRWLDDNGGDWQRFLQGAQASTSGRDVDWRLPDRDVVVIATDTLDVAHYQTGVMTMLMSLDINPISGEVLVVGTDADNHRRFEPQLNGVFARVEYARFISGEPSRSFDLNPHIDYSSSASPDALRVQSVGDPRALKWHPDGSQFYVAGMGSNNLVSLSADGQRTGRITVGEGPTGLALNAESNRGYTLNRFDGTITEFSLEPFALRSTTAFLDPTPDLVKAGRPHLYNTHTGSGHGHLACATCHVDARTDRLVWDLGRPDGDSGVLHHAMKSAMRTQPLGDVIRHPNMHWRGDRTELRDFAQTFSVLQGADAINGLEIAEFEHFLSSIHFPPSPWRNEDNSLPQSVLLPPNPVALFGNAALGRDKLNACLGCHSNNLSRSDVTSESMGQNIVPPDFVQFYKRLGYDALDGDEARSGFGFFHDGADALMTAVPDADLLAALLAFDGPDNGLSASQLRQDSHAALGRQHTVSGIATVADTQRLNTLIDYAAHPHLELIAKRHDGTGWSGYALDNSDQFIPDQNSAVALTPAELLSTAADGAVTFTLVMAGTESRIGVDQDLDAVLDGDDNRPPTLATPSSVAVRLNQRAEIDLNGNDLDGDTLTYRATGLPLGLAVNSDTGVIRGTPTVRGVSVVRLFADDGQSEAFATFELNVGDLDDTDGSSSATVVSAGGGVIGGGLLLLVLLRRRL